MYFCENSNDIYVCVYITCVEIYVPNDTLFSISFACSGKKLFHIFKNYLKNYVYNISNV